jgi:hypothetical protein
VCLSVIVKPRKMRRSRPPRGCRDIEKKMWRCTCCSNAHGSHYVVLPTGHAQAAVNTEEASTLCSVRPTRQLHGELILRPAKTRNRYSSVSATNVLVWGAGTLSRHWASSDENMSLSTAIKSGSLSFLHMTALFTVTYVQTQSSSVD